MVFKIVGADENNKFPQRIEDRLANDFVSTTIINTGGRLSPEQMEADWANQATEETVNNGRLSPAQMEADWANQATEETVNTGRLSPTSVDNNIRNVQAFRGNDGKRYVAIAGAVRRSGGVWSFISDTAHAPMNAVTVTEVDATSFEISFANTGATKINTFMIVPDETFAKQGVTVGSSVGVTSAIVEARKPVYNNGVLSKGASGWAVSGEMTLGEIGNTSIFVNNRVGMEPSLAAVGKTSPDYAVTKIGNSPSFPVLGALGDAFKAVISFTNSEGSLQNISDVAVGTNCLIVMNGTRILSMADMDNPFANFWFYGILEFPN